jgi:hypothetical protein
MLDAIVLVMQCVSATLLAAGALLSLYCLLADYSFISRCMRDEVSQRLPPRA